MVEGQPEIKVSVCFAYHCYHKGSPNILDTLQEGLKETPNVEVSKRDCLGNCDRGPNVLVTTGAEDIIFNGVGKRPGIQTRALISKIKTGKI